MAVPLGDVLWSLGYSRLGRMMRGSGRQARAVVLLGVVALAILSPLLTAPAAVAANTPRGPILIDGNGD
ncbi:MAG: hypothetical protein ACE5IJ_11460, partial [Thermoplasmata archaeon]